MLKTRTGLNVAVTATKKSQAMIPWACRRRKVDQRKSPLGEPNQDLSHSQHRRIMSYGSQTVPAIDCSTAVATYCGAQGMPAVENDSQFGNVGVLTQTCKTPGARIRHQGMKTPAEAFALTASDEQVPVDHYTAS
jgi:hypothetical protein